MKQPDMAFLGSEFPEPGMQPAAERGWDQMWPLDRAAMITRMLAYGGSFVHCLGRAFETADQANAHRLAQAFPELVQKYGPMWEKQ